MYILFGCSKDLCIQKARRWLSVSFCFTFLIIFNPGLPNGTCRMAPAPHQLGVLPFSQVAEGLILRID